jgi:hypothetical protein
MIWNMMIYKEDIFIIIIFLLFQHEKLKLLEELEEEKFDMED